MCVYNSASARYRHERTAQAMQRNILLVLVGVVLCVNFVGVRAFSGIYVDNGRGMTVLEERLNKQEKQILQSEMLHLLGLPSRPRLHKHHARTPKVHASAPKWLKGIYDTLDDRGHAQANDLDPEHVEAVGQADTIITFVNKHPVVHVGRHGKNKHLFFNVSDVSMEHSLLGAELRVHRHKGFEDNVILHVYMVTSEDGSQEKEIARTVLEDPGWVTINITTAALSWMIFPHTNLGLRLAVTKPGHKREIHFIEEGVSGAKDEEDYQPFLVGFFSLPSPSSLGKRMRVTRSTKNRRNMNYVTYGQSYDHGPSVSQKNAVCQKKTLFVSFKDLNWDEWVIAPDGYGANYCEGRCSFPLHNYLNATNHAIVQTLVHVIRSKSTDEPKPPAACCAPTELGTMSVVYFDYNNNVVLKKYPKMVVNTCGCL
ncbi:protein 60A-like [Oratosquilla oratoria]|uniref:protein 60A-like n=1 Tax=Oratosquilla oratoria TaxID=337810 RepID=UPI003F765E27